MLTGAPDTRHTWSGDFSIAYQVIGQGPSDLLYLPQFLSNGAWNWQVPEHARFMREAHDRLVRDEVAGARGRVVKSMGDGYLATFDGPARAIASAEAIVSASRDLGIEIRSGVAI